jgi:hypothetical protein
MARRLPRDPPDDAGTTLCAYPDRMALAHPRILAPLCAVLACLWLAGPVAAQGDVPNDNSGVDQYSESLPSSDGGRARSVGGHASQGVPLSSQVNSSLPSGARGRLLRRVATDPTLGAPVRSKKQPRIRPAAVLSAERPGAVSAIGGALFGSAAIWPIVLIMALSGVAAIAAAVARRRSS